MIRTLAIVAAICVALATPAIGQLLLLGIGTGAGGSGGGGGPTACLANGLDFTDGCGTTQYMVIFR